MSAFLKKAASSSPADTKQELQVWASFWTSKFPPSIRSLVYQVLWKKRKVGDKLKSWTQQPNCPVCHRVETVGHAVQSCAFHPLIHDTVDKCSEIPPNAQAGKSMVSLPEAKFLKHPAGVMLWVAHGMLHTRLSETQPRMGMWLRMTSSSKHGFSGLH